MLKMCGFFLCLRFVCTASVFVQSTKLSTFAREANALLKALKSWSVTSSEGFGVPCLFCTPGKIPFFSPNTIADQLPQAQD